VDSWNSHVISIGQLSLDRPSIVLVSPLDLIRLIEMQAACRRMKQKLSALRFDCAAAIEQIARQGGIGRLTNHALILKTCSTEKLAGQYMVWMDLGVDSQDMPVVIFSGMVGPL
jgi:hypothetical protein